jgi:dihydroorotate dehydrogenase
MYKYLLKPVFFLFDPEKIHYFVIRLFRFVLAIPLIGAIIRKYYRYDHPKLEKEVFGIRFPNPVGLAAGFDKDARMFRELQTLGFGFIEIGTLTPLGQEGNPKPRLFRLPSDHALINRMGFNNQGVEAAVERLKTRNPGLIIGGNIGKNKITPNENALDDYIICFNSLFPYVDYFVVNVSSPNTPNLRELQEKEPLLKLLSGIQDLNRKKSKPKPVLLKIAPDLTDGQLDDIISIISESGIDGVIATNTTISRENLATPKQKLDEIGTGGLSGLPVKDRSTEVIRYLHTKSGGRFPIIGVGGIHSPQDAIEKLNAGAALVQIYTGFIYEGPKLVKRIKKALVAHEK